MDAANDFLADLLAAAEADAADPAAAVVEPVVNAPHYVCTCCKTTRVQYSVTTPGAPGRRGRKATGPVHYGVCFYCDGGVRERRLLKVG